MGCSFSGEQLLWSQFTKSSGIVSRIRFIRLFILTGSWRAEKKALFALEAFEALQRRERHMTSIFRDIRPSHLGHFYSNKANSRQRIWFEDSFHINIDFNSAANSRVCHHDVSWCSNSRRRQIEFFFLDFEIASRVCKADYMKLLYFRIETSVKHFSSREALPQYHKIPYMPSGIRWNICSAWHDFFIFAMSYTC